MKPQYEGDTKCPICQGDAVALVLDEQAIYWCANGHVVDSGEGEPKLLNG